MGDSHTHLSQACDAMDELPGTRLVHRSRFIKTQPVGPINQAVFLNAAVVMETNLSPSGLLKSLNAIELKHGRDDLTSRVKWGPRPLDLDIIFYDSLVYDEEDLVIPHPLMHERWFVLKPLAEIVPDWVHPILGLTVVQMLDNVKP